MQNKTFSPSDFEFTSLYCVRFYTPYTYVGQDIQSARAMRI